jgi:hypothetical protein
MNYLDQIAERFASGPDLGLIEVFTTGVFVAAVIGSVFFALAVVLMVACYWQTMAEARERDRVKDRLRFGAIPPARCVASPAGARSSGAETVVLIGPRGRSWTFNVRHWTLIVSVDRIEKPA